MTVNGGSATVFSGGTASGSDVINGGVLTVSSGGTDKGATVGPGGTLNVSSGGVDSGSSVNGGTIDVSAGGSADKTSVGASGTLNVSSGGVVSALRINDPNDPAVSAVAQVAVRRHGRGHDQDRRWTADTGCRRRLSSACQPDDHEQRLADT